MECLDHNTKEVNFQRKWRKLQAEIKDLQISNKRLAITNEVMDDALKVLVAFTTCHVVYRFFIWMGWF